MHILDIAVDSILFIENNTTFQHNNMQAKLQYVKCYSVANDVFCEKLSS